MSTQYPTALDTSSTLPYVINNVSPVVADNVNILRDAIVAIETELGTSPSGTETTVKARIEAIESMLSLTAPNSAQYFVLAANVSLSNERVLNFASGLSTSDGGAGSEFLVELEESGVIAGTYLQPAFHVDGYGRITNINEGSFSGSAGNYLFSNLQIDGYGRLVSVSSGATNGATGKLAYWLTNEQVTSDGYIDVNDKHFVFNEDLILGVFAEGENALGISMPADYTIIESTTPMIISSNSNDGVLVGSNLRGSLGANSDNWALALFDGGRSFFTNKNAGLSFNMVAPNASMLDNSTPYTMGIVGLIALASGSDNDGYGSAIESEENLVITALGDELLLLANKAVSAPVITIGSIDGNGPSPSADWHDRYSDDVGHVWKIGQFIHRSDENDETQLLMGETSSYLRPSYSFMTDSNTGMYLRSDGYLGFAMNQDPVVSISYDGLFVRNGSQTRPSYAFDSGRTTGFYLLEENKKIGVTINGTVYYSITDTGLGATVPLIAGNGSATNPGFAFISDENTGFYRLSAETIGISNDGYLSFSISSSGLSGKTSPGSPFITSDAGTASLPAYSFAGDTDTGMYRFAGNGIGFAANGANVALLSSTSLILASGVQLQAASGSTASPGISFSADTNTGFLPGIADHIITSLGGIEANLSGAATTQTSDATPKTLYTFNTTSNKSYSIEYTIVARSTSSPLNTGVYYGIIAVKDNAGTASATLNALVTYEDEPSWAVSISVASNAVNINVTGDIGMDINWKGSFEIVSST